MEINLHMSNLKEILSIFRIEHLPVAKRVVLAFKNLKNPQLVGLSSNNDNIIRTVYSD